MIGIITYNHPHKKTQDLIFKLLLKGYKDIKVIATPYNTDRKNFQPIYKHRPSDAINISMSDLCDKVNIEFVKQNLDDLDEYLHTVDWDHILIGGAGILPEPIPNNHKIINSHPGYLPYVKGLDSLKWAILNGNPIGVTSHYISEKTDAGLLIERKIVPVYREDTFISVAYRQFKMEVDILVDAVDAIKTKSHFKDLTDDSIPATRRMPNRMENTMMEAFVKLTESSPSYREEVLPEMFSNAEKAN